MKDTQSLLKNLKRFNFTKRKQNCKNQKLNNNFNKSLNNFTIE